MEADHELVVSVTEARELLDVHDLSGTNHAGGQLEFALDCAQGDVQSGEKEQATILITVRR